MMMPGRKFSATTQYRYGFNGQEKSSEINDNSYNALYWEYESRLGRRWNVDPKPNVSISLYATFANNPIRFADPLGDSINKRSDQRLVEGIERGINRQITSNNTTITNSQNTITTNNAELVKLRAAVADGKLTEKELKKTNKEIKSLETSNTKATEKIAEVQAQTVHLQQSLADINALRADVNYNYTFGGAPGFGSGEHGVLRGTGNNVTIQGSDNGLYIHEIRHVGQSLANGGLRFSANPNTLGRLINAGNDAASRAAFEVDAYRTQFSYDRNSYPAPAGARSLSDINAVSLRTILGDNGTPLY